MAIIAALLADHPQSEDFTQLWWAARIMCEGGDPYALIGPGRAHAYPFPLYYPASAGVIVLPLSLVTANVGKLLFAAGGAAAFTMMLTRDGLAKLPWLASYPFLSCLYVVQWSTWLAAAAVYPVLGFLASGKPNVGVATLAATKTWRALLIAAGGCAVVSAIALALDPDWPARWLQVTSHVPHVRALALIHPAGLLLLAGLLRWRRPEARALVALAVVPHNPLPHNFLLVAAGRWTTLESAVLAALSWCTVPFIWPGGQQAANFEALSMTSGRACLFFLYLPATVLLLRKENTA
jgi:hypothetical protein